MRQINPKLRPYLDSVNAEMARMIEEGFKPTPTNAREWLAKLTDEMVDGPDIAGVYDDMVRCPGYPVPVRIYHPAPGAARPVLLHFHGGGHTAGSVSAYDPISRKIAEATGHIVVSVDYRRAPECPYPAAVLDVYGVVKHIWPVLEARGLAFERELSLIGDSAGGALAASVMRQAQFDLGVDLRRAVLIYPGLDYTLSRPSVQENAVGYLLQTSKVVWYYDLYFQTGENRRQASPLFGEFTPRLPETMVITAEFCPLRDEGVEYVAKLAEAGVKTKHLHLSDMPHTFMNLDRLVSDVCTRLYSEIATFLNQ